MDSDSLVPSQPVDAILPWTHAEKEKKRWTNVRVHRERFLAGNIFEFVGKKELRSDLQSGESKYLKSIILLGVIFPAWANINFCEVTFVSETHYCLKHLFQINDKKFRLK